MSQACNTDGKKARCQGSSSRSTEKKWLFKFLACSWCQKLLDVFRQFCSKFHYQFLIEKWNTEDDLYIFRTFFSTFLEVSFLTFSMRSNSNICEGVVHVSNFWYRFLTRVFFQCFFHETFYNSGWSKNHRELSMSLCWK